MIWNRRPSLRILLWFVIADFLAQIPYYLHNYYFRSHAAPSVSAIVLLGATLAWFLVGYIALRARKRYGFWLLLGFLVIEGLFYLVTLVSGIAAIQMQNPSLIIKAVYVIGYASGIVALVYVVALVRFRTSYLTASSKKRAPAEVP
jgi:hypothetical protein